MWTKWYLNFKQHTYLIAASQQTSYIKTSRVFRNFKLFQPLKSAAHNVSLQQTKTYPKQLQNSIWISTCTCTLPMFGFPYRFFLVKKQVSRCVKCIRYRSHTLLQMTTRDGANHPIQSHARPFWLLWIWLFASTYQHKWAVQARYWTVLI